MALLWMEGFDQYSSVVKPGRWDFMGTTQVLTSTRTPSGKMLNVLDPYWCEAVIADNVSTFILGFALYNGSGQTGNTFLTLMDANNNTQLFLRNESGGGFTFRSSGSTSLLAVTMPLNTWVYVEAKITIHDTAGAIECRIDGAVNATVSGIDTRNNAAASGVSRMRVGVNASLMGYQFYVDDMYVLDMTGTVNNDYLGDCEVTVLRPTADDTIQFSRSSGSTNVSNVSDVGDGDTSYVYTSTSGHKDMYSLADTTTTAVIFGVAATAEMRTGDVGLRNGRIHLASGGNAWSKDCIVTDTYRHAGQVISGATSGSTLWTTADVNAATIGFEAL